MAHLYPESRLSACHHVSPLRLPKQRSRKAIDRLPLHVRRAGVDERRGFGGLRHGSFAMITLEKQSSG